MPSSTFSYTSADGTQIAAYRWDPAGEPRVSGPVRPARAWPVASSALLALQPQITHWHRYSAGRNRHDVTSCRSYAQRCHIVPVMRSGTGRRDRRDDGSPEPTLPSSPMCHARTSGALVNANALSRSIGNV
jgi:hypothetical protein